MLSVRPLLKNVKSAVFGIESFKNALLDRLPSFIADPWDDRLKVLALGLKSVCTDWDLEPMKGLTCSRSLWMAHAAWAHSLVRYYKPRVIVDLGVLAGCSTIAMGLAIKRLGYGTIYAVDTWEGDEHTGLYGERVYERFLADVHFLGLEQYVVPLRMRFEDAVRTFDSPIDLLHIDGLHTFRAALSDFLLYRDRLSPGAPVLFHDVYNRDFPGLLALWPSLALQYRTFRFEHASGLEVLLARGGDRSLGLPRRCGVTESYAAIRRRTEPPTA